MKTLDQAIEMMKTWDGAIDTRDVTRFADFVPANRLPEIGITIDPADDGWNPTPWTEANIMAAIRRDVEVAYRAVLHNKHVPMQCMGYVLHMWNAIMENGLAPDTARDAVVLTARHYSIELPGELP